MGHGRERHPARRFALGPPPTPSATIARTPAVRVRPRDAGVGEAVVEPDRLLQRAEQKVVLILCADLPTG